MMVALGLIMMSLTEAKLFFLLITLLDSKSKAFHTIAMNPKLLITRM